MLKYIVFFSTFIFSVNSWALGLIENDCFYLNKDTYLQRLDSNSECDDSPMTFTTSSARGVERKGLGEKYAIEIVRNDKDKSQTVFETSFESHFSTISSSFPQILSTGLKSGKVVNHTICTRDLSKTNPVVKKDSLVCVTIDANLCNKMNAEMANWDRMGIKKISEADKKKCEDVNMAMMNSTLGALSEMWKDPNYKKMANKEFEGVKEFSDKQLSEKMKSHVSYNYNLSDSDPKTGAFEVASALSGIRWMNRVQSKCSEFFNENPVNNKKITPTKEERDAIAR